MAVIKSGDSTDQLKVDASSKAARTALYSPDGVAISSSNPLYVQVNGGSLPSGGGGGGSTSGTVSVSNFPQTQAVSAAALPLPDGAATDALQANGNASLVALADNSLAPGQATMANSSPVVLASDQAAVPISAAGLPLPAGAATESSLAALAGKLGSLGQKAAAGSAPVVLASDQGSLAVAVNNFPATQPISAASLPLAPGAATSSAQATGNASLASLDGKLPALGPTTMAASLPVTLASNQGSIATSVTNFPATQPVSAASLPLPAGAATASAQATGNASLSSLDTKTPAVGPALMAASTPVTLASNQGAISTTVGNFPATQPVSGSVSVSNLPTTQAVSAASLPLPSGAATDASLTALAGKFGALGQKASTASAPVVLASDQSAVATSVTNFPATQPVSAAALPLPTGSSTSALQTTGNASLSTLAGNSPSLGQKAMAGSVPVTLPSDLAALAVAVNNFPATQPVSAASLPLPAGAATAALQSSGNSSLAALLANSPSLGQKTMVGSIPVTIASDQPGGGSGSSSSVAVTNFPATQAISAASLPLPAGAATEASLAALAGKFGALGQKASTGSAPVVLASDQAALAVAVNNLPATQAISAAALPLPSGASTEATLSALSGKFGALGQKAAAGSAPVVLASDQAALATTVGNFPATQPVSAASLPLPAGASSSALQTAGNASLATLASNSPTLGQKATTASLPVTLPSDQGALAISGSVAVSNLPATQPVSATALPLPSGASTEATLAALAGKFGALGQKASTASAPVVLASDQSALATSVSNFPATQAISAAALPLPAGGATSALQTAGNSSLSTLAANSPTLGQKTMAGSVSVVLASDSPSSGSGTASTVSVSNFPATQAVSAASLPLPSGAATDASLTALSAKLGSLGQKASTASAPVVLASDQSALSVSVGNFPATQPVSGTISVSNFAATQPVSATALPLPAGAATSALQTTGNSSLASLVSNTPAVGQKTSANSSPVVLASDQAAVAVTFSGTTTTSDVPATTAVTTTFTYSTTTAAVLPSNASRKGLMIYNASTTATLWLNEGAAATLTSGYPVPPGATLTASPPGMFTGAINGIWTSGASGSAYVLERS